MGQHISQQVLCFLHEVKGFVREKDGNNRFCEMWKKKLVALLPHLKVPKFTAIKRAEGLAELRWKTLDVKGDTNQHLQAREVTGYRMKGAR